MKKITKKLSLARDTVRVLSGSELDGVIGAGAIPTTTVYRRESHGVAAVPCHRLSAVSRATIMCVRPPV